LRGLVSRIGGASHDPRRRNPDAVAERSRVLHKSDECAGETLGGLRVAVPQRLASHRHMALTPVASLRYSWR
jgi:hypothetical protein